MTVGRPITAGRSRDRCVSNVVSNPISDAARAPSPLYRARGQRRPSAASGLPIRNDFGTLSRVDRFQHGESQLKCRTRYLRETTSSARERSWGHPMPTLCFMLHSSFGRALRLECPNTWKYNSMYRKSSNEVGRSRCWAKGSIVHSNLATSWPVFPTVGPTPMTSYSYCTIHRYRRHSSGTLSNWAIICIVRNDPDPIMTNGGISFAESWKAHRSYCVAHVQARCLARHSCGVRRRFRHSWRWWRAVQSTSPSTYALAVSLWQVSATRLGFPRGSSLMRTFGNPTMISRPCDHDLVELAGLFAEIYV